MCSRRFYLLIAGALFATALCACHPSAPDSPHDQALERKVGQVLMVGFKGSKLTTEIRRNLHDLQPGGICLYKQNITGAHEVARLNEELRAEFSADNPPFIAVDQEGGTVVRIEEGATVFPSAMALGATRSAELATRLGRAEGRELRLLGFNMNLAPVLDVPDNPAIATRALSDQPAVITSLGSAYIVAQQSEMIATIAKHFPGEGRSQDDSHDKLPVRAESAEVLRGELEPFRNIIQRGQLDGLMTAHVAMPALSGDRLPATISPLLLTQLLRHEFGFDGLILTDELEGMRAVSSFGVGRAAVDAIKAGADMVFVAFSPGMQMEARQALLKAVRAGEISPARLDEALAHVQRLKQQRHVFDSPPPLEQRLRELDRHEAAVVAAEIARNSLTCLRLSPGILPLDRKTRIGIISDSDNFIDAIKVWTPQAQALSIHQYLMAHPRTLRRRLEQLQNQSDIIVAGFIESDHLKVARTVYRPLLVILMNVPEVNLVDEVPNAVAIIETYSYQPVSVRAAAEAIFTNASMPGKLPVNEAALENKSKPATLARHLDQK